MAHGKPFVHLSITPHLCQPKVVLTYIVLHFNQIQVSHNHHQFHNFLLIIFCYQNVEFKVKLQPVKWAGPTSPQLTCLFHLKWSSLLLLNSFSFSPLPCSHLLPGNVIQVRVLRCNVEWFLSSRPGGNVFETAQYCGYNVETQVCKGEVS